MSFDRAFEIVVGVEGGYVDDPRDPGGETKFGISKRSYPALDIKNLTLDQARDIYLHDYWLKAGCDQLVDDAMAILIFDAAVNMGVDRAKQLSMKGPNPVDFQAERALHYASLPTFTVYGRGWMRRLFRGLLQSGAKA